MLCAGDLTGRGWEDIEGYSGGVREYDDGFCGCGREYDRGLSRNAICRGGANLVACEGGELALGVGGELLVEGFEGGEAGAEGFGEGGIEAGAVGEGIEEGDEGIVALGAEEGDELL